MNNRLYQNRLYALQLELVKLQRDLIKQKKRILVIFEGRDGAGKDGTIKCITEHLSPRETRVVSLGKPSDREQSTWYFQRYIAQLPAASELVLFNRSWYNRAGVEPVIGFCTPEEHREFLATVPRLEEMLTRSGIALFKYYLDIDRKEQKKRLTARRKDPLKQWKLSPVDEQAVQRWDDYTHARNEMFLKTHHAAGPWYIVKADDKRAARINLIANLLSRLDYPGKEVQVLEPDLNLVFAFDNIQFKNGQIAS